MIIGQPLSVGGGKNPEVITTVAALEAKLTLANVGKVYKYTGTSSGDYIQNDYYQVNSDATAFTHYFGNSQSKTATANGTVSPDSGYLLSSVTVAIPTYVMPK